MEQSFLLRLIAAVVTDDSHFRRPPLAIEISPASGTVRLRFDDNAVADVEAWADVLGVRVTHDEVDGWRRVCNDEVGAPWHGWLLHIWCRVTDPVKRLSAGTFSTGSPPETGPTTTFRAVPSDALFTDGCGASIGAGAPDSFAPLVWPAPIKDAALCEDRVAFF
ncbi:hypothetical protein [Micromonospora sp. CB01531]|uniref:hypothetical protein n=1 Tax=Micromonospora sp. CB01531 TaxID=1718947 RepID=UPI001160F98C|nr:hypothetical protein [Micromonospora sp. CB01531]